MKKAFLVHGPAMKGKMDHRMNSMGKIYCLAGKSASGKDHFYKRLLEEESLSLLPLVLYTTRPMRLGEEEGREYHFVDEAKLTSLRQQGRIIEERSYHTTEGIWTYFTADDGQIDPEGQDYLSIGTLESIVKLQQYFGRDRICPLYIEVDDGERLARALQRERKQETPRYEEMCRRFLADQQDFSEDRIKEAGITKRFENVDFEVCLGEIVDFIRG